MQPPFLILLVAAVAAFWCGSRLTGSLVVRFGNLLDVPNERSSHANPTPTGGGIGFLIAFFLTAIPLSWFWPALTRPSPIVLLGLSLPLALIGFRDDRKGVPRSLRYAVQLVVALLAVRAFLPQSGFAVLLASSVAVTAVINFTNFMDGIDGLVGGVILVLSATAALCGLGDGWWLLAAALGGFLTHNWHPASIFMGDVGSTVLGLFVACQLLAGSGPAAHPALFAAFLPLYGDACYTLIRRASRRENIFAAHNSHIYQRLRRSGLPHDRVSRGYIALTAACAALGGAFGGFGLFLAGLLCLGAALLAERRAQRMNVPFALARRA